MVESGGEPGRPRHAGNREQQQGEAHGERAQPARTVGAAGSTGRGEANIKSCASFLAVEFMRQGMAPEAALLKVLERVVATTEKRLLDANGKPKFDLEFYAVTKDGRYAGATLYSGGRFAVCDDKGARLEPAAYLFKRA